VWPVPSLDIGAGIDSAAVSLFVERAQGIAPGFSMVNGDQAAAVTEICQRLDGIPLAIELAASRMASMTGGEMRDRLDHRFRLLVGSRRGLERHHTLRHAMAWSYELLDDTEKTVLDRCSVFAGGFDLQSACAVAGSDDLDEYAILEVLDALVRKSLLIADRSSGRTRFSMLETIRQFAEEQLVASGVADEARTAHAHYFAGREADILALWDSPRQREAYDWFTIELANLRTAFRWAADQGDLDAAVTMATCMGFLGNLIENYEPVLWAEELIEAARAVDHPRLAALYVTASQCYTTGRIEEAVRYCDAGQIVLGSSREAMPYGMEACLGGPYVYIGQPERWVEVCRAQLARHRDTDVVIRVALVFALAVAGSGEEAMVAADGPEEAAEATGNPLVLSFTLSAYGFAFRDADPVRALDAYRRGLVIAQDSGNRFNESQLALNLARQEALLGDAASAFDHFSLAIHNYHDSGDAMSMRTPLAVLAALLDRLGRYESAATIVGFALGPLTTVAFREIGTAITHLREVLGDQAYESLARKGETMTTAAMVTYALDQIDQARAELNVVSK
jgi:tetratricopeptide (TPR) repeat protein